ncbi:Transposase and inactivated derivatives [Spirosoma endophyticum]|uniref:Transposase and inactivated derivatives n=2 Tax=Spirosoma endophyticum TaxID=662367 RepID=A0A1I1VL19_9BACT|nr:Transposase and inactivated derivatives [Spirosoma endophyticum]
MLRPAYPGESSQNALPSFQKASIRTVPNSLDTSTVSLLRGKSQPQTDLPDKDHLVPVNARYSPNPDSSLSDPPVWSDTSPKPDLIMEPTEESATFPLTGDVGENILQLLTKGQSVAQISALLQISKTLVKRWQRRLTTSDFMKMDGRRLYDDAFKQDAIRQLNQGVSVRKLSLQLGVSQVTLHKWKNKELMDRESHLYQFMHDPLPDAQDGSRAASNTGETGSPTTDNLSQQLQELREERDILKKALVILLRSS